MIQTIRKAWGIPELRKKIIFTLLILLIFRIGFEGGQMPLARRLPKRGFNNIFATPLEIINLSALNAFEDGDVVNVEALLAKGILSKCEYGFKVLGNGKVTKKVTVEASAFSASAKEAIEAAGGKAEVK